jgi:hypothetical protein
VAYGDTLAVAIDKSLKIRPYTTIAEQQPVSYLQQHGIDLKTIAQLQITRRGNPLNGRGSYPNYHPPMGRCSASKALHRVNGFAAAGVARKFEIAYAGEVQK